MTDPYLDDLPLTSLDGELFSLSGEFLILKLKGSDTVSVKEVHGFLFCVKASIFVGVVC